MLERTRFVQNNTKRFYQQQAQQHASNIGL